MSALQQDVLLIVALILALLVALAAWSSAVVRRRRRTGACPDCGAEIDRRYRTRCEPCVERRRQTRCVRCRRREAVPTEELCATCIYRVELEEAEWDARIARGEH
ncbi:hypothetical protein [Serinicoccus sediminis]|uniref:hypothetical protein n=1 Tax=Serinicoccus sediminis TaxID=2306021 RepID=UPI00102246BE|nr:hypothetical protein [Serinicoccus sediminis]